MCCGQNGHICSANGSLLCHPTSVFWGNVPVLNLARSTCIFVCWTLHMFQFPKVILCCCMCATLAWSLYIHTIYQYKVIQICILVHDWQVYHDNGTTAIRLLTRLSSSKFKSFIILTCDYKYMYIHIHNI